MKTLTAAVAVAGLGLSVLVTQAGPAYAAETCRGRSVTLLGTPGQPLFGTADADVIVSNGASFVAALAGDDVICASGDGHVDAGEGDDVVDTTAQSRGDVDLGGGADQFFGGPGYDDVRAAGVHDPAVGPLPEVVRQDETSCAWRGTSRSCGSSAPCPSSPW